VRGTLAQRGGLGERRWRLQAVGGCGGSAQGGWRGAGDTRGAGASHTTGTAAAQEWALKRHRRRRSALERWQGALERGGAGARAQAEASDGGVAAHGRHKSRSGAQDQAAHAALERLGALFLGWSGRNAALAVVAATDTRCGSGNPAPVGSGRGKSFGGVLGHAVVLTDQLVGDPKP
jgi:hypothetical protein